VCGVRGSVAFEKYVGRHASESREVAFGQLRFRSCRAPLAGRPAVAGSSTKAPLLLGCSSGSWQSWQRKRARESARTRTRGEGPGSPERRSGAAGAASAILKHRNPFVGQGIRMIPGDHSRGPPSKCRARAARRAIECRRGPMLGKDRSGSIIAQILLQYLIVC